jgi:serine/threonine-protein kinase
MSLSPGVRLGPYEIVAPLGAGGMGEVYRARDTRLGREVAVKVLPQEFAQDVERLARFQREAQILASLNHPNIAQIHGLEESAGARALVLELVEGPTLAERLERGPLPIEEALEICRQIASALEAAHEGGVIHRDLKPGNVKITPGGEVKVLDFGLAKGGAATSAGSDPALTHSPTRTYGATQSGVILGTAAYMSPEQARGKPIDRRTDIWSFGCVLYECLTGRQTFEGETTSDMIARILEREPEWSALPGRTPPRVRDLLARCLEKDARKRLRDIGDARIEIEGVLATRSSSGAIRAPAAEAAAPTTRARGERLIGLALALAVGAALGASALSVLRPTTPHAPSAASHLSIAFPPDFRVGGGLALSSDASTLAIVGSEMAPDGKVAPILRIYIRRMAGREFEALAGSEGVSQDTPPLFSRDNRSLFFVARARAEGGSAKLFRAAVDGSSPPVALCDWDGTWQGFAIAPNGEYVVLSNLGTQFLRIPANGSPAGSMIPIDGGSSKAIYRAIGQGTWIDADRLLLESVSYGPRGWIIGVAALDTRSGKATPIVEEGGNPVCLPSGHLVFSRSDVLLAAPFDPKELKLTGVPTAVLGGLRTRTVYEPARFKIAGDRALIYGPGGRVGDARRLVIIGADGKIESAFDERKSFREPRALPGGERVSVTATNSRGIDEIWVSDVGRHGLRRLIAMPEADCAWSLWSPSGDRIAFTRFAHDEQSGLYIQRVDAADDERRLVIQDSVDVVTHLASSWSADGTRLLVTASRSGPGDIAMLTFLPDGSTRLEPLIATPANEDQAAISPDSRWVAFVSDESGQNEVYLCAVRADGSAGSRIPVSRGPGEGPVWSRDGRRIGYVGADSRVRSVNVTTEPTLSLSAPVEGPDLEPLQLIEGIGLPGGRAIAIQRGEGEGDVTHLEIVLNWTEELRQRLAKEAGTAPR